ncbi:MAG TPA: SRPBCC family protein [Alphaproteobacteria bacterium]|nr:SRPBCC family protein [Alphaproteobacteria bacterium]
MPYVSKSKELYFPIDFLFSIALDVKRYQEFLPGVHSSQVFEESAQSFKGRLKIGAGPFSLDYISTVTYERPFWIKATCEDKTFKNLQTSWVFKELSPQKVLVTCEVFFELRKGNFFLNAAIATSLSKSSSGLLESFCKRAHHLKTSSPQQNLACVP